MTNNSHKHTSAMRVATFSPDGNLVLAGSNDGWMTCSKWQVGGEISRWHPLQGQKGAINSLCFSPSGNYVASGFSDGTVIAWKTNDVLASHTITVICSAHEDAKVTLVAFTRDDVLVSAAKDGTVHVRPVISME